MKRSLIKSLDCAIAWVEDSMQHASREEVALVSSAAKSLRDARVALGHLEDTLADVKYEVRQQLLQDGHGWKTAERLAAFAADWCADAPYDIEYHLEVARLRHKFDFLPDHLNSALDDLTFRRAMLGEGQS